MELVRILKDKKFMIGFLLLLFAAAGIYYYEQIATLNHWEEYKKYMQDSVIEEIAAYQPYEDRQAEYAASYQRSIQDIIERAETISDISIFQNPDSFSKNNIEKTKEAYERIVTVRLTNGNYEALENVISYDTAGYITFLFVFFMIWFYSEEKNAGLKRIIFAAPKGRGNLAARQMGALMAAVSLFTVAVYACILVASIYIYGIPGSLHASVQSVILFGKFTYPFTILEYLFLFLALRIIFAVASAFFVWMIIELFRNRIFGLVMIIMIYGLEAVFYFNIPDTSVWSPLKYINVFGLVNPAEILYEYRNFNLIGKPVNCFAATLILAVGLSTVSIAVILRIAETRKPVYASNRGEEFLEYLAARLKEAFHNRCARLSLAGFEIYKICIVNKGAFLLVVWLCVLLSQMDFTKINFIGKSLLLNEIYLEYAGPDDGRLRSYVSGQEALINEAQAQYDIKCNEYENGDIGEAEYQAAAQIYSSYSTLIDCIEDIKGQISYIEGIKEEREIPAWIVYEKPFRILLTENGIYQGQGYGKQEFDAICNLLLVFFLMSGIFSYDRLSGIQPVIRCSQNGRRKLFRMRISMVFLICLLVYTITYGLRLIEVNSNYPIMSLGAPVQSLTFMDNFPLEISIGCFLVFLFVSHVLILFAEALIALKIMDLLPGIKGLTVAIIVLIIPQLAYMLGFEEAFFCSAVQPLIYVEILNRFGFYISMAVMLFVILVGIMCCRSLNNRWCGKRMNHET